MTGILALILAASMAMLASCGGNTSADTTGESDTAAESVVEIEMPESEFDYSAGLDENGFFAGVKASDYVTLPDYKGIELTRADVEGSEEALNEQIEMLLAEHVTYEQLTEGAIADGDTVNIDYVGSIDGVEFEGGSTGGYGTDVTIGVTNYIDDFIEQLIGHKPGENFDIEVTFPEDYGNEELNGKDAIFNITVNYLQGDPIEAVLNDEIAATYGFETVDALKEDIMNWLKSTAAYTAFSNIVAEATCEEYPEAAINYYINSDKFNIEYYAEMSGVTVDEYIKNSLGAESFDAYVEQNMSYYEESALQFLVAQAIAEIEGLTVTDADVEAAGYTEYVGYYGAPYVKQVLLYQETVPAFIVANANIVD